MLDFLSNVASGLTWQRALVGVVVFLITFSASLGLVSLILIKLPSDSFLQPLRQENLVGTRAGTQNRRRDW